MTSAAAGTVHSILDEALGNTSYVVEVDDGIAVVVDPPRDVAPHLELASARRLRVVASVETHVHADYVTGSRELAARARSEVVVPRDAGVRHADRHVGDGDQLEWGHRALRVLATPGHTPEHLAYLLIDDERPRAVFSGGSLILGGAARTDLVGPACTEDLARSQFASLRRLAALPDNTALYPTHGAGSFCLATGTTATNPTVGTERRTNPMLQIGDEDEFVRVLTAGFGAFPTYYRQLPGLNARGPALLGELSEPQPLPPERVAALVRRGAWLIDARSIHDWAAAHPEGAISIELRPAFASWLGWIVPFGAPIVLLVDGDRRADAVRLARQIGYDQVLGWIDGGIAAWHDAGLPTRRVEETDPLGVERLVQRGAKLLDVRQPAELERGRIPGAQHLELGDIAAGRVPDALEVVPFCGHGERSATAASLLEQRGIRTFNLAGGMEAWEAAGLPVDR